NLKVAFANLQLERSHFEQLLFNYVARTLQRAAGNGHGAAAPGAQSMRPLRVVTDDAHLVEADSDLISTDLSQCSLDSLPVRASAGEDSDRPVRLEAHPHRVIVGVNLWMAAAAVLECAAPSNTLISFAALLPAEPLHLFHYFLDGGIDASAVDHLASGHVVRTFGTFDRVFQHE